MSHFSKIQTQIIDIEVLKQALEQLGFQDITQGEGLPIHGVGTTSKAQLVAAGNFKDWSGGSQRRHFGFSRQADNTLSLEIDAWMLAVDEVKNLTSRIQQRYAANIAKASLTAQGFTLIEETLEDGEIHLALVRV